MQRRARRLALRHLLVAALVLGLGRAALADPNDITVGGVWVCKITHGAAGVTADERVVQVQQRITNVLSTERFRRGAAIYLRPSGRDAVISVGDQSGEVLVFTVTPDDAEGTSLSTLRLARQWASRLVEGLEKAMPSSRFHMF